MSDDSMTFHEYQRRLLAHRHESRGLAVFRRLPSSHELAGRVVSEYTREGTQPPVVDLYAWEQTAGQGRHDRRWSSPPGAGVYASLIRPRLQVPIQSLSLRVAVALCRALRRHLDDAAVRWPNDLQVGEKKIGGILIDVVSHGDEAPIALISFGVDHASDVSVFDEERATSVLAEGGDVDLAELAASLTDSVDGLLDAGAQLDVVESYAELAVHRPGDAMQVTQGESRIAGIFRGFDENGFLRLEVDGDERRIAAGEL